MSKKYSIFTINDIPVSQKWMYEKRHTKFDKNLNLLDRFCHHVYNTITIDNDGLVFRCVCHPWLPVPVGNILDFNSFEEIIQNKISQEIVNSIEDGSYRYCDQLSCSMIINDTIERYKPNYNNIFLNLAIDESCNLSCPSCRTHLKFVSEDNFLYKSKMRIVIHLLHLLKQYKFPIKISIGDGDPFASLIYRYFFSNLDLHNLEIEIVTKGLLIKDFWKKIKNLHNNIIRIKISIDAGSSSVYNIVRRGGDWYKLLENLEFIKDFRTNNNCNFILAGNFVVQSRNFTDITNYVQTCLHYNFDEINFQKIQDWGTYIKDFESLEVWKSNNAYFPDFKNIMKDPLLKNPKINFNNLKEIYDEITRTS